MFTTLEINGFRGIAALRLEDLAPVTLFTGENGVGKTTILEAALALYGRFNPQWIFNLQAHRGFEKWRADEGPIYTGLFECFASTGKASVTGHDESGVPKVAVIEKTASSVSTPSAATGSSTTAATRPRSELVARAYDGKEEVNAATVSASIKDGALRIDVKGAREHEHHALLMHPSPRTAGTEEEERFGDARASGRAASIIEGMRAFDSRIENIEFVRTSSGQYFLVHLKDGVAPLGLMGGGINNVFRFLVNLDYTRGGWLGIDEIENGIYYKLLPDLLSKLVDAALSTRTQLMMTTHSGEAVRALAAVSKERLYNDVGIVHLRRDPAGGIRSTRYRGDEFVASTELGYELR